ncbi:hypothetical protein SORBI_3001G135600 [Sorghum bicolor]|uniref:GDSL esterase/lipase n=1 Tax=Sorghum bicolor TaxID=4558 RepID=A0A1Z5S5I1_SORBI|nr:hypothetical protein SORBI_3001G135600 [Sorghum bicolor]
MKMSSSSVPAAAAVAAVLLLSAVWTTTTVTGQALVPGVMIFGDSVVDAGNNNRLATLVRADFPPYGRDFPATHAPTGRFCNGKLATDYTVESLGLSSYPPAYLSEEAQSNNKSLLHGANFASGAAGYLDATAGLYGAISLRRQAEYFREYQSRVAASAGERRARELTSGSIYVVSAGTSDYVQNYYVNPMLSAAYTPDQFADALMPPFTSFVEVETVAGLAVVQSCMFLCNIISAGAARPVQLFSPQPLARSRHCRHERTSTSMLLLCNGVQGEKKEETRTVNHLSGDGRTLETAGTY